MSDAILGLGACAVGFTCGIGLLFKGNTWGLLLLFGAVFLFPVHLKAYLEE